MGEDPAENIKQYFCSYCGTEINKDCIVCPNCGISQGRIIDKRDKSVTPFGGNPEKNEDILACPTNGPVDPKLSEIIKLTFSIACKTFEYNTILVMALIPAVLIFIIGCNLLLFSQKYTENNLTFIYPQMVKTQYTRLEAAGSGDNKLAFTYPDNCKKLIKLNDIIWVYSDNRIKEWFAGYVSEIEEANGTTRTDNKVYVKTLNKDIITEPGIKYNIVIKDPAPKAILTIDNEAIYNKGGQASVYIVLNGKAKSVGIKTGTVNKGRTEVLSGISMRDTLIKSTIPRKDNLRDGIDASPKIETKYIISFIIPILGILIFITAVAALYYGITKAASWAIEKEEYSVSKIFRSIFSIPFLKALISELSLVIVVSGPLISVLFFLDRLDDNGLLNIGFFLLFLAITWFVCASIKYNFIFAHSVISGEGVKNSFKKSSSLVKIFWGRTFAILLLVSIIINLITSVISIPIADFIVWHLIDHSKDFDTMDRIEISMYFTVIIIPLFIIIRSFIDPVFTTVMYYDLKNRKNDFIL